MNRGSHVLSLCRSVCSRVTLVECVCAVHVSVMCHCPPVTECSRGVFTLGIIVHRDVQSEQGFTDECVVVCLCVVDVCRL